MFYPIITKSANDWFLSKDCHIKDLIAYMQERQALRDAQIEAIKTYLYLKIKCENKPLWQLFNEGYFDLDLKLRDLPIQFANYLSKNKQMLTLYALSHYLPKKDLMQHIQRLFIQYEIQGIDCESIFKSLFYNVFYTDYLFSLPMGAGKTYLMAAFMYLDLYFAQNEPHNKAFAHNFLVLAPSGLKSSIIPSLRSIKNFDVSWILPEPSASKLKKLIKFEILNQNKTNKKSNKIQNPNVSKIASYQPYESMFGLILLTNAEKVILEKLDKNVLYEKLNEEEKRDWSSANELRDNIAKIPNLGIFIDEVHHATNDEVKLRQVVNTWNQKGSINMVAGFSGTPYLKSSEKIFIDETLKIEHKEIANIVYYYPLIKGIGNFLKNPVLKTANSSNRLEIVEQALREFFTNYETYSNSIGGKIAIYCGSIENLEEQIYPKVCEVLAQFNLDSSCVLRFHKGNKAYPEPKDALNAFENLDSDLSPIRVILLVQIGKEGWDCKSLSGVVLSQEGDCPKNMVLQTACRCLRQVDREKREKALIYLNDFNTKKLAEQLKQEQKMDIEDFQYGKKAECIEIKRFDRTQKLNLKTIDFYQLKLIFENYTKTKADPINAIKAIEPQKQELIIKEQDFNNKILHTAIVQRQDKKQAHFNLWLYELIKESFHTLSFEDLRPFEDTLKKLFSHIIYKENGILYFKADYDEKALQASIRGAFCDKRDFKAKKELIPQNAHLLIASKLSSPLFVENTKDFIPEQEEVLRIIDEDCGKVGIALNQQEQEIIKQLESLGQFGAIKAMQDRANSHPHKNNTYHYLPYQTDSAYERYVFEQILSLDSFKKLNLELYYNGDSSLSELSIQTFHKNTNLGRYTPDFIILQRKAKEIYKILILETKGEAFVEAFKGKKEFMSEFIKANNDKFKYERFSFLYLQDNIHKDSKLISTINDALNNFFDTTT
ncbi:DEAD/DEAH box helicase [Helicobacter turcicus]|uniref:DEAD/DEAH box helicase family protein n=1 Tax=Helicobacter turcicus TaxID=2867412 RepID=A0ABS7JQ79_9HELI|nr:DEAD/DEAH box helicase family protein [Helicobacter turcicus]MBX7491535.1 DEAD/DEAH box helicase family protein [Helicobacter turcicus]MBX7546391.1 DEAD/DEAH box helicase family protein [Helicobacter turcicus]